MSTSRIGPASLYLWHSDVILGGEEQVEKVRNFLEEVSRDSGSECEWLKMSGSDKEVAVNHVSVN
jgi:hypothetical protein